VRLRMFFFVFLFFLSWWDLEDDCRIGGRRDFSTSNIGRWIEHVNATARLTESAVDRRCTSSHAENYHALTPRFDEWYLTFPYHVHTVWTRYCTCTYDPVLFDEQSRVGRGPHVTDTRIE
jgi:hypothetical protein